MIYAVIFWSCVVLLTFIAGWVRGGREEGIGNARFMLAMPVALLGSLIYVLGHASLFVAECLLAAGQWLVDRVAATIVGD